MTNPDTPAWSLVIHGGAGTMARDTLDTAQQAAFRAALAAALAAGQGVLVAGGSALDAVVASVRTMEDDALFNAKRDGRAQAQLAPPVAPPDEVRDASGF